MYTFCFYDGKTDYLKVKETVSNSLDYINQWNYNDPVTLAKGQANLEKNTFCMLNKNLRRNTVLRVNGTSPSTSQYECLITRSRACYVCVYVTCVRAWKISGHVPFEGKPSSITERSSWPSRTDAVSAFRRGTRCSITKLRVTSNWCIT